MDRAFSLNTISGDISSDSISVGAIKKSSDLAGGVEFKNIGLSYKINTHSQGYEIELFKLGSRVALLEYSWREGPPVIHTDNPNDGFVLNNNVLVSSKGRVGRVISTESEIGITISEDLSPDDGIYLPLISMIDTMWANRVGFFSRRPAQPVVQEGLPKSAAAP